MACGLSKRMWKLVLLILCVPTPNDCPPHVQLAVYNLDKPADIYSYPSQASCLERRDLIRDQASAFVLSAQCYQGMVKPVVKLK